jgi:hypothetical protein
VVLSAEELEDFHLLVAGCRRVGLGLVIGVHLLRVSSAP